MVAKFAALFRGGEYGHGNWNPKGGASTLRSPATPEDYARHLSGEVGLGIAPVTSAGVVYFAAIDIDVDTIDHADLYQKVQTRKLPLTVCRSKSGGAHLYLFSQHGHPASMIQALLRKWATLLGFPRVEIFPKQLKVGPGNIGNWINLPYFSGDNTTRYAVGPNGAMSLQEFLDSVVYYKEDVRVDETAEAGTSPLPPCLAALAKHKLPEGGRNTVLFNTAVFYRKSRPADWEDAVIQHNSTAFDPPLPFREVQTIVSSVGRAKYQYSCEQDPVRQYCDRAACQLLPYGVSHMPWKEQGAYDDLLVGNLRKVLSDPPRYLVEVNGRELEVSADDFLNFAAFRKQAYLKLDLMVQPLKQPQWDQQIKQLTADMNVVEAPEDASIKGLVIERLHEFLSLKDRAMSREDILKGLPVQDNDLILFKISDFRRHLQIYKLDTKVEMGELFMMLQNEGASHKRVRVAGKLITVWGFPLVRLNQQTDDFVEPDFKAVTQEEL
jgi:hypothetical protein